MTHHTIILSEASSNRASYGIAHESTYVYQTSKSHGPTRIVVWDNTGRPNPDRGKSLGDKLANGNVVTTYTADSDITRCLYLDPHNRPTNAPQSVLISPEDSVMCADTRFNTGQPGSGQVYAHGDTILRDSDTVTLVAATARTGTLRFTNNGHGYVDLDR